MAVKMPAGPAPMMRMSVCMENPPFRGHADFPYQVQHVLAEALLVGGGVAGLVDAAVDGAAQVLDKGAVNALVHPADLEILVQGDAGEFLFNNGMPSFYK